MKQFTFRIPHTMNFIFVIAATPAEAIRQLVGAHGKKPYDLVCISRA